MRRIAIAALLLSTSSAVTFGQQGGAPPAFEVASVKLHPNQLRGGPRRFGDVSLPMVRLLPGGRIESSGHMLRSLLAWAHNFDKPYQRVVGDDDLLLAELVIEVRAPTPSLTADEARAMMRTLLEQRFRLRGGCSRAR